MIFFDIDGTLIDHKKAEILGVEKFYSNQNKYFNISNNDFYKKWCEISNKNFEKFLKGELSFIEQRIERVKDIFLLANIRLTDNEAEEKFKIYVDCYEGALAPYEDTLHCLESLKGYRLGIISNGDLKQQILKLEKICDPKIFDVVITAGDVKVAKPDTKIFEIACQRAGVSIQESFYIGDDISSDMYPCTKAGMKGIWINRTNDRNYHKDFNTVYDLRDIIKIL